MKAGESLYCWKDYLRSAIGCAITASVTWGHIRVLIFLYAKFGGLGIWIGLTVVPPILVCPIWEWIAEGTPFTFVLVYVSAGAGMYLLKKLDNW